MSMACLTAAVSSTVMHVVGHHCIMPWHVVCAPVSQQPTGAVSVMEAILA